MLGRKTSSRHLDGGHCSAVEAALLWRPIAAARPSSVHFARTNAASSSRSFLFVCDCGQQ